jgi:hypothetical protein
MCWKNKSLTIPTLLRVRETTERESDMESNDLWEALGTLEDDQAMQVLTQLFARYERELDRFPGDPAAETFFHNLALIMVQVQSCNLNRR